MPPPTNRPKPERDCLRRKAAAIRKLQTRHLAHVCGLLAGGIFPRAKRSFGGRAPALPTGGGIFRIGGVKRRANVAQILRSQLRIEAAEIFSGIFRTSGFRNRDYIIANRPYQHDLREGCATPAGDFRNTPPHIALPLPKRIYAIVGMPRRTRRGTRTHSAPRLSALYRTRPPSHGSGRTFCMSPAPRLPMRHCRISPPRCNSAQGAHCLGNRKAALPAQQTEVCAIRPEPAQAAPHARFAPAQSAFSEKTLPTGNALSRQLRTTPPTKSSVPYISSVSAASIPSLTPRRRARTSSERRRPMR